MGGEQLPGWVIVGASFRDEAGPIEFHRVYHVRAIVDDRAVLRFWRASKRRWEYVVECPAFFEFRQSNIKQL
jgi:hypothetical protein